MTTQLITAEETIKLLERAVAEKGETYTYPDLQKEHTPYRDGGGNCLYRNTETMAPACIVGHVLDYLGVLDQATEGDVAGTLTVVTHLFEVHAVRALDEAQRSQDGGHTWGESLADAKDRVGYSR